MTNASGGIPCAQQSFYAGMGWVCFVRIRLLTEPDWAVSLR